MSKISIIKKIQLGGARSFPLENPDSELCFTFYCGNGAIKHKAVISWKSSNLLRLLIESDQISKNDLIENHVDKREYLEDLDRAFLYRYQIFDFKECNNNYLIIFDINEHRDYYGCFVYGVLQIQIDSA